MIEMLSLSSRHPITVTGAVTKQRSWRSTKTSNIPCKLALPESFVAKLTHSSILRSLQFDPAPRAGEPLVSRRVPDVRFHLPLFVESQFETDGTPSFTVFPVNTSRTLHNSYLFLDRDSPSPFPFLCTHICIRTASFFAARFPSLYNDFPRHLLPFLRAVFNPQSTLILSFHQQYLPNSQKSDLPPPTLSPYSDTPALSHPLRLSALSTFIDCTFVLGFFVVGESLESAVERKNEN